MKLAQAFQTPSWIVFQLLEQCNLRCEMCYEWGATGVYRESKALAKLPLEIVLRTIRECLPFKPRFELFGGEPLLYPGIWDVIRAIRAGGCEVAFPTNGTLLEDDAELLVEAQPTRVFVSLDGPEPINDRQRGAGVFRRALRGLERVHAVKVSRGARYPELGVTCVVTPLNHGHIEELFLGQLDLSMLSAVSLELQSYATAAEHEEYARTLRSEFGVPSSPCARAYVRDPADFASIDVERLVQQMVAVRSACEQRGIWFHSQPRTLTVENLRSYLAADWTAMADHKSRCAVPWVHAEISARGDVTTCHTFYDLTIGNVHERSLLDLWRGERLGQVQRYLRSGLFPICTACCRYHSSAPEAAR
jgi:MoaA/NifB/PqqE/SkfB family radical SAM enzyme